MLYAKFMPLNIGIFHPGFPILHVFFLYTHSRAYVKPTEGNFIACKLSITTLNAKHKIFFQPVNKPNQCEINLFFCDLLLL